MKMHILAFRDVKANYFLPPFFVPNIPAAIRELGEEVNNPQTQAPWAKWPEDHELYEMGAFESESGFFDTEHDGSQTERKQLMLMSALKR